MRTRRGLVALSPNEIDLLQQCFDTLIESTFCSERAATLT